MLQNSSFSEPWSFLSSDVTYRDDVEPILTNTQKLIEGHRKLKM